MFIVFSFITLYSFIELYSQNHKVKVSFIALPPLKGVKHKATLPMKKVFNQYAGYLIAASRLCFQGLDACELQQDNSSDQGTPRKYPIKAPRIAQDARFIPIRANILA